MDRLANLARSSFRKTGLIGLALWILCFIIILACTKHARIERVGVAHAALAPLVKIDPVKIDPVHLDPIERDARGGINLQQATVTPTATITPTLTATGTISPTVTVTRTATLSPTASASPTWTPVFVSSPTTSPSPSSQATVSATTTPDLIGTLLDMPTAILTSTIGAPPVVLTETATLIPFPDITIQIATATSTDALNYLEAPPGENGLPKGSASIPMKLRRWWPVAFILFFWLVLSVWFLAARAGPELRLVACSAEPAGNAELRGNSGRPVISILRVEISMEYRRKPQLRDPNSQPHPERAGKAYAGRFPDRRC